MTYNVFGGTLSLTQSINQSASSFLNFFDVKFRSPEFRGHPNKCVKAKM